MVKHLNIKVYGQVKGVDFRTTAKQQADGLGITGIAKNKSYGVYIEAEGQPQTLQKFVDWCHVGSEWSKVESVETEQGQVQGYKDFTIIRSLLW